MRATRVLETHCHHHQSQLPLWAFSRGIKLCKYLSTFSPINQKDRNTLKVRKHHKMLQHQERPAELQPHNPRSQSKTESHLSLIASPQDQPRSSNKITTGTLSQKAKQKPRPLPLTRTDSQASTWLYLPAVGFSFTAHVRSLSNSATPLQLKDGETEQQLQKA